MSTRTLAIVAWLFVIDAVLLLIIGCAMWSDAPSEADEAVGKGLVALSAAIAVPALFLVCSYLNRRAVEPQAAWDDMVAPE